MANCFRRNFSLKTKNSNLLFKTENFTIDYNKEISIAPNPGTLQNPTLLNIQTPITLFGNEGYYFLPDGQVGQLVYFCPTSTCPSNSVSIIVQNARLNGSVIVNALLEPFYFFSVCKLLFTETSCQVISGGAFDY